MSALTEILDALPAAATARDAENGQTRLGPADRYRDGERDSLRKLGGDLSQSAETPPEADEKAAFAHLQEAITAVQGAYIAYEHAVDLKEELINGHAAELRERTEQKRLEQEAAKPPAKKPSKPKPRGFLQPGNFDVNKLSDEAQKHLAGTLEWVDDYYNKQFSGSLIGQTKGAPKGTMCLYSRGVGALQHDLLLLYDATGDTKHLDRLVKVVKAWLSLTVTTFMPGFDPRFKGLDADRHRHFNLSSNMPDGEPTEGWLRNGGFTDVYPLDFCLQEGRAAEARYGLWLNRGHSRELDETLKDLIEYTNGVIATRREYSKKFFPNAPDYAWVKGLHHPFEAFYGEAFYMVAMGVKSSEDDLAYAQKALRDEYTIKNGLYHTGHFVTAQYAVQGTEITPGSQDSTYIQEEWPAAELLCRAGDKQVYTPETMAAMARTFDQKIMADGYDKETTRRTLSGVGTEHIRQATRGLTSVPLWRIYDERIDRDLKTLDSGEDAVRYNRHGARFTRFLGAIGGRL